MLIRACTPLLLATFFCASAFAAPATSDTARKVRDPFNLDIQRFELKSGMRVLLQKDASLPQVVVSLWFDVGSKDESTGRTGFAHLYEHLMFMGTKNVPGGGFDQIMEAEGGQNNATTNADRTYYYDMGPSHLLPTLLYLEAERLTTLPESMTDEKVGLQREVVRNERRQSYENRPYGKAELLMSESMYEKGHPYSWPVIGSHEDLLRTSTSDVKKFFYKYYTASNATLAVVGDINPQETRRLIEHFFGWMPRSEKAPRLPNFSRPEPQRPVLTTVQVEDQVELPRIYLLWHAPKAGTAGAIETQVLADVLGRGKSSRLYRALVFEKQLAQSVEVDIEPQVLGSLLICSITARKGVKHADLLAAIRSELSRLAAQPLTQEELDRARNQRLTEWAREIETLLGRSQRMQQMQAYHDDPNGLTREVEHLRRLTPAEVLARASSLGLTDPKRQLLVTVVPAKKPAAGGAPAQAVASAPTPPAAAQNLAEHPPEPAAQKLPIDLSKHPSLLPVQPFNPPRTARFRVGQLDVLLVRRPGDALLEAQVVVPGGSGAVPAEQAGLSSAVAAMLTEGAGARSAQQVAEDLERLGATLRATATQDAITVSLGVMAERYPDAAPILFDVVAHPRLSPADWKRVQAERMGEVARARSEPRYLADRGLMAAIFGDQHPYGIAPLGREATLGKLQAADLQAFHATYFQPQQLVLVVAGDVDLTRAQAEQLAGPFARWQGAPGAQKDPIKRTPPAPRPTVPRLVLIDRPGAPQSEVRVANLAQGRTSPDRPMADVANTLLGGTFTSRLNQNLREQHGWAYGAQSRFLRYRDAGIFVAQAAVRTDATADALMETIKEMRTMQQAPVPQKELDKGRKLMVQRVLMLCERVAGLAQTFGEIALYGLPPDELGQLISGVQHTTADKVQKVARNFFLPDRATVVLLGDRQKIEPALHRLNLALGPLEVRNEDGDLLPLAPAPGRR